MAVGVGLLTVVGLAERRQPMRGLSDFTSRPQGKHYIVYNQS